MFIDEEIVVPSDPADVARRCAPNVGDVGIRGEIIVRELGEHTKKSYCRRRAAAAR